MKKNDFLDDFAKQLAGLSTPEKQDFHIALSGGLDSVVLLHLFARLREITPGVTLHAHHINHGLSANAQNWSAFCAALCADLQVNFNCSSVDLQKKNRTSIEALAREKRYICLQQGLSVDSYLVTAHHQDDQLETVLLALKRGSGNTGLQGVRHKQKLKTGHLIRPLLNYSRAHLEAYARSFKLDWIEDESNQDQAFDRNFIRHSIAPLLKQRWPGIAKSVARSATICQEQQQVLDELAEQDFKVAAFCFLNQQALSCEVLQQLSAGRRNNVLRFWFKENRLDYPSSAQLKTVWTDIVLANNDALPVMRFKEHSIRRYRNHLYLLADKQIIPHSGASIVWQGEQTVSLLAGRIKLAFNYEQETDDVSDMLSCNAHSKIEICFREHLPAKLTCKPQGRNCSRSIKKLLHEYHVPPWLRDTVPFILINGELRAALGLWSCQPSANQDNDRHLNIFVVKH